MPIRLEDVERKAEEARLYYEAHPESLVTPMYGVTMRVAGDTMREDVRRAAQTETVRTAQAAEEDALGIFSAGSPPQWAQYAVFDGGTDERTCPLCGLLIGMEVRVGSSEYYAYAPPCHISCRHWYTYHDKHEPTARPFEEPPPALVAKHGHFVSNPRKYSPLRVPVVPGQANFTPRRERDPLTGEYTERLRWLKQPETPLTPGARDLLRQVAETPQVVPAEVFGGAGSRELQELQRAGYVRVQATLGEPQTMRVTKQTVGEVEDFLRQSYAGARVQEIRQVGALDVGGGTLVPQWEVVYAEVNARKILPTKWGLAAVEAHGGAATE
jgi:hypothetical protein